MSEILYHYCSTESFFSIITSKTIRLSSLQQSNDAQEGKLLQATLMDLAREKELNKSFYRLTETVMTSVCEFMHGLGFCMSKEADLLSQWRGYADDAKGISIGFSRDYFLALTAEKLKAGSKRLQLHDIKYEAQEHKEAVQPLFYELVEFYDRGDLPRFLLELEGAIPDKEADAIQTAIRPLIQKIMLHTLEMYALKASAFREEKEVRLLYMGINESTDWKSLGYRVSKGKVIPYREFSLANLPKPPIKEIWLGPKHANSEGLIQGFLAAHGMPDVEIRKSKASYR